MAVTDIYGTPVLAEASAANVANSNEAGTVRESIDRRSIVDRDATAPPGGESEGDIYIPAATATGAWAGQEGKLAIKNQSKSGGWQFLTGWEGARFWVADEDVWVWYNGSAWERCGGFGAIWADGNATGQALATNTWEKVLNFNTNSTKGWNTTEDQANDELLLGATGLWLASIGGTFSGSTTTIEWQLRYNGSAVGPVVDILGGGPAPAYRTLAFGPVPITVTTTGQDVELWVRSAVAATTIRNRSLILSAHRADKH